MEDEKYVYIQDQKEKKVTARSSRNIRTHCGKGGKVKFPSDHLSKKELKEMSGEVKSYRLNDPMTWDEFTAMPDDLKVAYIKRIREKFNPPDAYIGKMFGVAQRTISLHLIDLGCNSGLHTRGRCTQWDKDGFLAWCNGSPPPVITTETVVDTPETLEPPVPEAPEMASLKDIAEPVPVSAPEIKKAIPHSGSMTFEGRIEDMLNTVSVLLGGAYSKVCISWEVYQPEGGAKRE